MVGVLLLVLVLIGVPLRYWAHQRAVVAIVGPVHGVLFIVYVLLSLDLARRSRMPLLRTALVAVAGTVPFLTFVAERSTTHWVRARINGDAATPPPA